MAADDPGGTVPFIVWGTKGVTQTAEQGTFHCPSCGEQDYAHKRVRRFFTLYWIPLIPLNTVAEYVECGRCTNTWDLAVLDRDPEADGAAFRSKVHVAAHRLMALMVVADGEVDDAEITEMVRVADDVLGEPMSLDEARAAIADAIENPQPVTAHVAEVKDSLNQNGKHLLLAVAWAIAKADGEISDGERLLMLELGDALELDVTDAVAT